MFTNPYISGELARDRQRELRAQAARERFARGNSKESSRPGTLTIGIAFAAAVLAASAVGAAGAHAAVSPHAMSAPAATAAQSFTCKGCWRRASIIPAPAIGKAGGYVLTADEHFTVPAIGKRQHEPVVQKVRIDYF
jgi:hypothetical protein